MKIIALRHGEKDLHGNLTEHGKQTSREVGTKIIPLQNPLALSSTTLRVQETVAEFLEGNRSSSDIKERKYLSIEGFSPEFDKRWGEELKRGVDQNQMVQDFLDGKWSESTPQNEAKRFIHKLLQILRAEKKNKKELSDMLVGIHATAIESTLITLFSYDLPDSWRTPINFSEHASITIEDNDEDPYLKIEYRGEIRVMSLSQMENLYSALYLKKSHS